MNKWTEYEFLHHDIWYHATSEVYFKRILEKGIIADCNKGSELDFGFGFYLTPSLEWVKKYAQGFNNPRIIEFHFEPIHLLNGSDNYCFWENLNDSFADFVFDNRMNFQNTSSLCVHNYLLVGGVMSDGQQVTDFIEYRKGEISKEELYRRLCIPKEDWQLMIHDQELCNAIKPCSAFDLEGGIYDVSEYKKSN